VAESCYSCVKAEKCGICGTVTEGLKCIDAIASASDVGKYCGGKCINTFDFSYLRDLLIFGKSLIFSNATLTPTD
jgi:hypothetical protein